MANPFSVPLPVYDFSVLGEIGNAYNTARSQAQNAETQRQFAENAKAQHERESAEELRRRDEFEMKKADRRANAIKSAGELIKLGRTAEAQALLSQHGFDVTPEMGAPTVVTPQPVDIMLGAQKPVEQAVPVGQHSGSPITDMRAPVDVQPEPMPQPEPTLDPAAFLQPGTPTGALSLSMGGKPAGRLDPAEEQRFRAERAARVEGALGPLGDKITAIADLAARGDLDANQAAALYRMIQADDSLAARNKQAEEQRTFQAAENEKYKGPPLTFEQRKELAGIGAAGRVAAARVSANNPLKIDTANRQDMGTLRSGFKEWKNTVNLAIDSKSHKRLATAMANLDSGNAMQQREAAESLVSIFKGGGQVTKASQDLLLHNLAGIVGDAQTFIEKKLSGKYGERELNVLKQATRNALAEEQEKLHAYHDSAVDTFGPGSGYEQLGANVNALVKGAFKQFGYDAEDIYPGANQPVVLGSGERPAAAAPKAPKKSAAPPSAKEDVGATRMVNGKQWRKVGPNNWQPVTP